MVGKASFAAYCLVFHLLLRGRPVRGARHRLLREAHREGGTVHGEPLPHALAQVAGVELRAWCFERALHRWVLYIAAGPRKAPVTKKRAGLCHSYLRGVGQCTLGWRGD